MKSGALPSENKLSELSFDFSVATVNLVGNAAVPKSAYMTDQHSRQAGTSVGANRKALWKR